MSFIVAPNEARYTWDRTSNYDLVGTKGFEPLYGGTKIHRLTTWRCPKKPVMNEKDGVRTRDPERDRLVLYH